MSSEDILKQMEEEIQSAMPSDIRITDVEFEGAALVVYTLDPEKFAEKNEIIKQLAKKLQKRIMVRADPSVLEEMEKAEEKIKSIIPDEAKLVNIYFEPDVGEVTIEVEKPGLAIGKKGALLNEIRKTIGWSPKVIRAPPMPSKTVQDIRRYLRMVAEERIQFLRKLGRRLHRGTSDGEKWVRVTSRWLPAGGAFMFTAFHT